MTVRRGPMAIVATAAGFVGALGLHLSGSKTPMARTSTGQNSSVSVPTTGNLGSGNNGSGNSRQSHSATSTGGSSSALRVATGATEQYGYGQLAVRVTVHGATITALGVKNIIILGGTSAVSAAVETSVKALPGVTVLQRLAGADRTLTAQQVALWETQGVPAGSYTKLNALGFNWGSTVNVDITNGANFPDALAAGPALATAGALTSGVPTGEPLLLTATPTVLGAGIPAFLGGTSAHVATVSAIGLASAVSPSVLASAGGSIS